ncbi:MAG: class I SAM-dependent methyltransferase family protein [Halobacteriaceae archaeon]
MTEPPAPASGAGGGAPVAAVVPKPEAEAAVDRYRRAGVYDDRRSVRERDAETVEVPVTGPPGDRADGREVVVQTDPPWRPTGLQSRLRERGFTREEIERAPGSWAVVGGVVLARFDGCPRRAEVARALLDLHGEAHTVLDRRGIAGPHREPAVEVVAGRGRTETVHTEHGTEYALDLANVMFSPGNEAERVRMGEAVRPGEAVLDMFAGVGYFALPMARAGARVTAVECNPAAVEYLLRNRRRNGVRERLSVVRADCRDAVGAGVGHGADRVVMGHFDAGEYLAPALAALADGGTLHVHAVGHESERERPAERVRAAADRPVAAECRVVKTFSEGLEHVVVDAAVGGD